MTAIRQLCLMCLALVLVACSDGESRSASAGADPTTDCDGRCADTGDGPRLTTDDVARILAQGVFEAQARGVNATLAVVDRVGNVLGVFRMGAANQRFVLIATEFSDSDGIINAEPDQTFAVSGGLEGIKLPNPNNNVDNDGDDVDNRGPLARANLDHLAAISKAITGAYLSTEGMAFTSRTANQIVQDHFNPGEQFQPGGPLFGVQFSQLGCSDFMRAADVVPATGQTEFDAAAALLPNAATAGPHSSPLGLAADAGGLPLYKSGSLVGGIGVMADAVYGLDPFIGDTDRDLDEIIAIASGFGFNAPASRRATITVEGKNFRYSDADEGFLLSDPTQAPALSTISANVGRLIAVRGYTDGLLKAGTRFGMPDSGVRAAAPGESIVDASLDPFVFVDRQNQVRYAPRAGTDAASLGNANPLSAAEVRAVLEGALGVANEARAQIRRPLGTAARVTISVVDTQGEILGMVRSRDAPVFGADVSLQKARTAAFFSSDSAATYLRTPPLTEPTNFSSSQTGFPLTIYIQPDRRGRAGEIDITNTVRIDSYVDQLQEFLGFDPVQNPVLTGQHAFSDRAGGNLSRPNYPDGIDGNPPGPLSKPPGEWSIFSTGLQFDLANNAILQHALFAGTGDERGAVDDLTATAFPPLDFAGCAGKNLRVLNRPRFREVTGVRLANGLQIFPGSVPIYRGRQLVGAIGISGDGVDQDDLIAFMGVHNASLALNGSIDNAPMDIRADQLAPMGVRLRYVQCPQNPYIGSTEDNVCDGL